MAEEADKAEQPPLAVVATEVKASTTSAYPAPFASRVAGREKRRLARLFGLRNIGVNLTTLAPGAQSALKHRHTRAEEFVYILSGSATLITDSGERELTPGMCAGFPPGGVAHHLVNRGAEPVVYLEIGDNPPDDAAQYPDDDLAVQRDENGNWRFTRSNGAPLRD